MKRYEITKCSRRATIVELLMGACIGALVGASTGSMGHWQIISGMASPPGFAVEGAGVGALVGLISGAILVRAFFHEQIEWSTGMKCGAMLGGLGLGILAGIATAVSSNPKMHDDTYLLAIFAFGVLGMMLGIVIGAFLGFVPSLLGWVAMKYINRLK